MLSFCTCKVFYRNVRIYIILYQKYLMSLLVSLDKEGKALHLSYEDRIKLVAYTQQASHGPLDVHSAPPLGVLDVIGRDRRAAWQALGQMSQIQAMAGFIHTLDRYAFMSSFHTHGTHIIYYLHLFLS